MTSLLTSLARALDAAVRRGGVHQLLPRSTYKPVAAECARLERRPRALTHAAGRRRCDLHPGLAGVARRCGSREWPVMWVRADAVPTRRTAAARAAAARPRPAARRAGGARSRGRGARHRSAAPAGRPSACTWCCTTWRGCPWTTIVEWFGGTVDQVDGHLDAGFDGAGRRSSTGPDDRASETGWRGRGRRVRLDGRGARGQRATIAAAHTQCRPRRRHRRCAGRVEKVTRRGATATAAAQRRASVSSSTSPAPPPNALAAASAASPPIAT